MLSNAAFGQTPVGIIGGTTRDCDNGKPVPQVRIIARSLDKGTENATVTGTDGAFTLANLQPGRYEVAAIKNGFEKSSTPVEVAASRTVHVDLSLQIAADLRSLEKADNAPLTAREKKMLERIEHLEDRLAAMETKAHRRRLSQKRPREILRRRKRY